MTEEGYLVRVQLIRSDIEGEYISGSFDYEVPPTTSIYQDPLFMRAEKFYKRLQSLLSGAGKVTVTDREALKNGNG